MKNPFKVPFKVIKLLALAIAFAVIIYRAAKISAVAELDKVSELIFNNDYSAADVCEMLDGVYCGKLTEKWGKPDGEMSGYRADIWNIGNNKTIIVYYDDHGYVKNVRIDDVEDDTE